jgi:prephenate dehydrogenase
MAGSEKWGPEHATPALYEGAVTFVEERTDHAEDAHATVVRLWESVGSRVVQMNPGEHDTIVARTSHVPHIVASALINSLIGDPERLKPFLGAGFRDTTRVADGRPEIWRDICLTNPEAVYTGLMELSERLRFVANSTRDLKGAELERFFADAVEKRKRIQ